MSGPATPPAPAGQPLPRADAPQPWPGSPAHAPVAPAAAPAAAAPATPPAAAPALAPAAPDAANDPRRIEDDVIAALRTCYDPEIPLNIYDLALIYGVEVHPDGVVHVRMTLTSPTCPVAGTLPGEVQQKVAGVKGVTAAHVALVWDPPWEPSMLSEAARLQLGLP
jgi:FeS assembly SUF system protein